MISFLRIQYMPSLWEYYLAYLEYAKSTILSYFLLYQETASKAIFCCYSKQGGWRNSNSIQATYFKYNGRPRGLEPPLRAPQALVLPLHQGLHDWIRLYCLYVLNNDSFCKVIQDSLIYCFFYFCLYDELLILLHYYTYKMNKQEQYHSVKAPV